MAKLMAAPSREILEAALTGLEAQRDKIDQQISQVRTMLGGKARTGKVGRPMKTAISHPLVSDAFAAEPRKRVLSPEARKRIATAQKKRWAAFRKTNS